MSNINEYIVKLRYDEKSLIFVDADGKELPLIRGFSPLDECWHVNIDGQIYRADTVLYKMKHSQWVFRFRYKDGDPFNLKLENIAPLKIGRGYPLNSKRESSLKADPTAQTSTSNQIVRSEGEIPDETEAGVGTRSEKQDKKDKEALELDTLKKLPQLYLYDKGVLQNRADDSVIDRDITICGTTYSLETLLYYLVTGEVQHSFYYLDGNQSNKKFSNLLPEDFAVSSPTEKDYYLIQKYIDLDNEEQKLCWKNRMYKNSLDTSILLDSAVDLNFGQYTLVNLFGKIIPQGRVMRIILDETGEEILQASEFVEEIREPEIEDEGPYGREKVIACFYCGDNTALTRDHVLPVSYTSETRTYNQKDVVPCCRECNSLLGNKMLLTVEDRAMYLAEKLATRYGSTLRSFGYSQEELETFGPRLKSMLKANVNKKNFVVSRIDHCHKIAGSLYSEESISHLRGLSTRAKRSAYSLIESYINDVRTMEQLKTFTAMKADEYRVELKDILDIIGERVHQDVAIQFKYDHGFKLDAPLKAIKRLQLKG